MPTLNWLTRDADIHAATGDPDAGNMLIQGDNLEALKALLPFYAGQVKCIYIDLSAGCFQMTADERWRLP